MEATITIAVTINNLDAFKKSLNIGNIPIKPRGVLSGIMYITIFYNKNSYEYIRIKENTRPEDTNDVYFNYIDIPYFHLPPEIQKDIVSRTKQNNCIGFLFDVIANKACGGFDWDESPEGEEWWREVLGNRKYDIYFKKFPKTPSIYDESIASVHYGSDSGIDWSKFKTVSTKVDNSSFKTISDIKCNDTFWIGYHNDYEIQKELYNKLKREEDESRLQKQEDPLRRGDSGKPVKLHTGKHKVRIAVQHLSYKKIIGRG